MDLTAEYARMYGGAPRADQSWHEVLGLVRRINRFEARARLAVLDGSSLAQPAGDSAASSLRGMQLAKLQRIGGL